MAKPRRRKCKTCREWFEPKFSNEPCCEKEECRKEFKVNELMKKAKKALVKIRSDNRQEDKKVKAKRTKQKESIKPIKYWYDKLQIVINQWVVKVRDKDKPCCTCGTSNPDIKYDAGHYRTRGACPELRFNEMNIHKQCSVNCNQHGSGMRKEYQGFIIFNYGEDKLNWLDGKHQPLKEQYADYEAVKAQIAYYRQLLRDAGIKPSI